MTEGTEGVPPKLMKDLGDLIEWAQSGSRSVGSAFEAQDDDWDPMAFGLDEEGHGVVVAIDPGFFRDEASKDVLAYGVLPKLINDAKLKAIAVLVSTWGVELKDEEEKKAYEASGIGASQHPRRVEQLFMVCMDQQITTTYKALIVRRPSEPPLLAEWEPVVTQGGETPVLKGRMVDPIQEAIRSRGEGVSV